MRGGTEILEPEQHGHAVEAEDPREPEPDQGLDPEEGAAANQDPEAHRHTQLDGVRVFVDEATGRRSQRCDQCAGPLRDLRPRSTPRDGRARPGWLTSGHRFGITQAWPSHLSHSSATKHARASSSQSTTTPPPSETWCGACSATAPRCWSATTARRTARGTSRRRRGRRSSGIRATKARASRCGPCWPRRTGKGSAMRSPMDADGQHFPGDLPVLRGRAHRRTRLDGAGSEGPRRRRSPALERVRSALFELVDLVRNGTPPARHPVRIPRVPGPGGERARGRTPPLRIRDRRAAPGGVGWHPDPLPADHGSCTRRTGLHISGWSSTTSGSLP